MAKITKVILIPVLALLVWTCASQIGPSGGEVDKIPPEIVETYPEPNTVNYKENYVEFNFSEYVDKISVQNSIFISPAIEGKIEYDWSGHSLQLIFEDSLKKNITYTFTVGTDVIDLNNRNHMTKSYSLTFSTGSKIDRCEITGKVLNKNVQGTLIFAYRSRDTIPNPIHQKPDYISQVGADGHYSLKGLSESEYYIFAVFDEYRNMLYNAGDDQFACPFQIISLTQKDTLFEGMDFILSKEDTVEPALSSITMTDKNHMLLEFSESIDSTKISGDNFILLDSTISKIYPVKYFYKGKNKPGNYFISFGDSLSGENDNYLIAKDIYDKAGNRLRKQVVPLVISSKQDTSAPTINFINAEYENKTVDFLNPYLYVSFDDGVSSDILGQSVVISDSKNNLYGCQIERIDDALFKVNIINQLKSRNEYEIKINYTNLYDAAGNKSDSTFTSKFMTVSELDFSALSGKVERNFNDDVIIDITNTENVKISYKLNVKSGTDFNFKRVRPGRYIISGFVDKNQNEKFDFGHVSPFGFAERMVVYPDTIKLNARWPVRDVSLDFRK